MNKVLSVSAELLILFLTAGSAYGATRAFTVAEEIGLAHFGDPYEAQAEAVQFSPNQEYVAAYVERGRIDVNRPEGELRVYRAQDVRQFLGDHQGKVPPEPFWAFTRATSPEGRVMAHWRWLSDSTGIAFLERDPHASHRLVLADLKTKAFRTLTPDGRDVRAYDIRDAKHYVYALAERNPGRRTEAERNAVAYVATGRDLSSLLFSVDEHPEMARMSDRCELWAVLGGKPFAVTNPDSGSRLVLFSEGQNNLSLSPDGESLVTVLAIKEVPTTWETHYPPPYAASAYRARAGAQDLTSSSGYVFVGGYVRIDLRHGTAQSIAEGPTGDAAGWWVGASPGWSQDGTEILLPNAFVSSGNQSPARPCVTVINLSTMTRTCVEPIKGADATGSYEKSTFIGDARLEGPDGHELSVTYYDRGTEGHRTFRQSTTGTWELVDKAAGDGPLPRQGLEVVVKQGLNDPPVLRATDTAAHVSRLLWDPNPQLKDIALGEASVYQWQDKAGRDWKGGLYKPVPYEPGHRYPLVIQTHGFAEAEFRPSGVFPTAFAARALAGAGVVVLQVRDCPIQGTPQEGPCNVDGYETAVNALAKEGLVDPDRVGIIGFSRTCYYVMEALTASALHIKAASVTDGVMMDYLQYLLTADLDDNRVAHEYDEMAGARPFGDGLQQWRTRSPLFNIDKVQAPLLVVAGEGAATLQTMWGPYAALRYLHKPVELLVLNTEEHVQSNPAGRVASQGGSVDWFRFWLQGYEDPDPAKADQYNRWRDLRKLQVAQDAERAGLSKERSTAR